MSLNATLIAQLIVFLILVWFTMKYIWPPIVNAMEERAKRIAEGLSAADRARKELADADARVAEEIKAARAEAALIVERANQQATQMVDKARSDALLEAAKLKSAAQADIDNMAHRARAELRGQVAQLAIAGAEKILKREIDANAHKALIDQLVTEI